MADSLDAGQANARAGLDRRQFLRRAGAVGAAAWAVPTIMTMKPAAAAEVTSPPPEPPREVVPPETAAPPAVGGTTLDPGAASPGTQVAAATASRPQQLPNTGADSERLVAAGLTAIAGGAALSLWSADGARRSSLRPLEAGTEPPAPDDT